MSNKSFLGLVDVPGVLYVRPCSGQAAADSNIVLEGSGLAPSSSISEISEIGRKAASFEDDEGELEI